MLMLLLLGFYSASAGVCTQYYCASCYKIKIKLKEEVPHCTKLLKKMGCCQKYIRHDTGLFGQKGCLKTDSSSENKILENLCTDSNKKICKEDEFVEEKQENFIANLTDNLEKGFQQYENFTADGVCITVSDSASPLFRTTLIICIFTALGLLGVFGLLLHHRKKALEESEKGRCSHIMATSGTIGAAGLMSVYGNNIPERQSDEAKKLTDI
ncbi:Oidioi.mRNA.OKI2018_I69.chr1.g2695.t1.cds [Oikopleura dioica]|uniref:Oidioi.mRNA.OKI2018_I69.chr1.g2695.t1.cds n=1 Tax=Oikopleura dioica TaxID=34765 RepID=A0ABN7STM0_OIKDI|nr:Oidioi.mRNA.OKI2018_I69.chr1.g2695.t1.cds [Oikopleura dioica]